MRWIGRGMHPGRCDGSKRPGNHLQAPARAITSTCGRWQQPAASLASSPVLLLLLLLAHLVILGKDASVQPPQALLLRQARNTSSWSLRHVPACCAGCKPAAQLWTPSAFPTGCRRRRSLHENLHSNMATAVREQARTCTTPLSTLRNVAAGTTPLPLPPAAAAALLPPWP